MAPPKNLVTAVCIILSVPISYSIYQSMSPIAAVVALVLIGIVVPQLYGRIAVSTSETNRR